MQLTLHNTGASLVIQSYDSDSITIDGQRYDQSVAFAAEGPVIDWDVENVAELSADHAQPLLAMEPEVIILATGERTALPPAQFMAEFGRRGIGFEAMGLGAACRTYAVLSGDNRRVVIGIII